MAFYGFLRASEFATPSLKWQHVQRTSNAYTIFIEQSKTDPFCCGCSITIYASSTSTFPEKALQLYAEAAQRGQILSIKPPATHTYNLSSFAEHIIQYTKQYYFCHSFQSGGATTAAAAG